MGWAAAAFLVGANCVDASMIGAGYQQVYGLSIPNSANYSSGQVFDLLVSNMNVFASASAAVTTGLGITTGNIEFWPINYGTGANGPAIGGNSGTYDFDDSGFTSSAGYGSMQIHNYGARETILAYNRFGAGGTSDLGIGNQPTGHPDWTFAGNAGTYTVKNLEVWVGNNSNVVPEPSSLLLCMFGLVCSGVGWKRHRRAAR